MDYFKEILATVQLDPEAAADPQLASEFRQPFTYVLPLEPEFDVRPVEPTFFETRVPTWADAGMPSGMIVEAIGGGRNDPCDATSEPLPIATAPRAVFDYLRTVPGLELSPKVTSVIDELSAWEATVTAPAGTPDCPELYPWAEGGPDSMPAGAPLRMIAVSVGGELIVFTIFGEQGNPDWPPLADRILASIDFQ